MAATWKNHWRVVAFAFVALALVGTGLQFAVISSPERYPLCVVDDHYISLFAISGFACTLVGVLLFLYAIKNTTESMSGHL